MICLADFTWAVTFSFVEKTLTKIIINNNNDNNKIIKMNANPQFVYPDQELPKPERSNRHRLHVFL